MSFTTDQNKSVFQRLVGASPDITYIQQSGRFHPFGPCSIDAMNSKASILYDYEKRHEKQLCKSVRMRNLLIDLNLFERKEKMYKNKNDRKFFLLHNVIRC